MSVQSLFIILCVLNCAWADVLVSMPVKAHIKKKLQPCKEASETKLKELYYQNALENIHAANKANSVIHNCKVYTNQDGATQHITFTLSVGDESCDFYFKLDPTQQNQYDLLNSDEVDSYSKKCHFKRQTPPKDADTPCKEKEIPMFLSDLATFINVPEINKHSFSVRDCKISNKHGRNVQLDLTDGKKRQFSVSIYTVVPGWEPEITSVPKDFLERLVAEHTTVVHPGTTDKITAKSAPCAVEKTGKYLEDFVKLTKNSSIKASDFIIRGCTTQFYKGWIINLDLTDKSGYDFSASMFFLPFSKKEGAVLYDKPEALEHIKNLSENPQFLLEETKEESSPQDLPKQNNNKGKKQKLGGWTPKDDCSEYVEMFENYLGVRKGYYNGQKGKNCQRKLVNGWSVMFQLEDRRKTIHVTGSIPAGNVAARFSTIPSAYVSDVRRLEGVDNACTQEEKRNLIKHFPTYAATPGFITKFGFTENIKKCRRMGTRHDFGFSFDEKTCDMTLLVDGDKLYTQSTTCIRDAQFV